MIWLLHPEAEADIEDAAAFYSQRSGPQLAQAFLGEFEQAMQLLVAHPLLGSIWRQSKRRLVMKHFPFSVIYTVAGTELRVLAVAHQSRRPGYWRKRCW